MDSWLRYIETITDGMRHLSVSDFHATELAVADGFSRWVAMTHAAKERDSQIFFIGNGGSAGMASHMAADACKNGHLRALALNDVAMITATANDVAYEQVFTLALQRLARKGDLLITISSSGNSPNVVHALGAAREMGMGTVSLSAKRSDNKSRTLGDINFYVPLARYGWAESAHQVVLHHWFDQYLDLHRDGAL